MKLEELTNFYAICKYKSFSRAAQELYLSRQALIRSINGLEAELKRQLFSRGTMGVELTDFGKVFFEEAKAVKTQMESLCHLSDKYDEIYGKHITFGIRGNFGSAFALKQHIGNFKEKYPDVDIEIITCENTELEALIQDKAIDMAFSILPPSLSTIEGETLYTIELALLMKRSDPLAVEPKITAEMLRGRKFMVVSFSEHTCRLFSDYIELAGFEPDIEYITSDFNLLFTAVSRYNFIGVTITRDAQIGEYLFNDLISRSFEPPLILEQGILFLKNREYTKAQLDFINYLREHFFGMDYRLP